MVVRDSCRTPHLHLSLHTLLHLDNSLCNLSFYNLDRPLKMCIHIYLFLDWWHNKLDLHTLLYNPVSNLEKVLHADKYICSQSYSIDNLDMNTWNCTKGALDQGHYKHMWEYHLLVYIWHYHKIWNIQELGMVIF